MILGEAGGAGKGAETKAKAAWWPLQPWSPPGGTGRLVIPDLLRGLAIVNIVLIHTVDWSGKSYVPRWVHDVTLLVEVPFFLFLSGWCATLSGRWDLRRFVRRLVSLYIPFLILVLFLALVSARVSHMPLAPGTLLDLLAFRHVDNSRGQWKVVIGSLWFLPVFLMALVSTPLLVRVSGAARRAAVIAGIALAYAGAWVYARPLASFPRLLSTSWHVLFFCLFFYALGIYTAGGRLTTGWFAGLAGALGAMLVWHFHGAPQPLRTLGMDMLKYRHEPVYGAWALLGVLAALWFKGFERFVARHVPGTDVGRFLLWSGMNSYTIYLYQGFGGSVLPQPVEGLKTLGWHWWQVLLVAFSFNMAVTYALTLVFARVNALALGWLPGKGPRPARRSAPG